jgi:hypothetical protein
MNLAINQGQAIRSITGRSLVTHFMTYLLQLGSKRPYQGRDSQEKYQKRTAHFQRLTRALSPLLAASE